MACSYSCFGRYLLESGDLDPVYIMLYKANLSPRQLHAWLLAYWCFYHSGLCSDIAEAEDYWEAMKRACAPGQPRGTERRHFRGAQALEAVSQLRKRFSTATSAIEWLSSDLRFWELYGKMTSWPMFGPWIAFKAADMLERVAGLPVDFSRCDLALYDTPKRGAALIATGDPKGPVDVGAVVNRLIEEFSGHLAPPRYDRSVGIQEAETILCKYKSHWGGHYPLGKDTRETAHSLRGRGPLAQRLLGYLPSGE